MSNAPIDVLVVQLAVEPAGSLGQWRGVAYIDGVAEFPTIETFDTKEGAERAARKLRLHAESLARENAAARAAVAGIGGAK